MDALNNNLKLYSRRKELRNNATPQEIMLWARLKNSQLNCKFRRQQSIGKYIVDFYCHSKKIVVEVDGSQHFEKDVVVYDIARTQYLFALGLKVLRFSNAEINTNINGVILKIQLEL